MAIHRPSSVGHYLTLVYTDPLGKEQVVVFDLAQEAVQGTLKFIGDQSGRAIDYQLDQRKSASPRGTRTSDGHPSVADLYKTKVEQLAAALQREDSRLEASETLRGLIDSIVLTPEKGQLRIELRGNLAAMLTVAQQTKRSPETGDLFMPVQMVAGARLRLYRKLCWVAA